MPGRGVIRGTKTVIRRFATVLAFCAVLAIGFGLGTWIGSSRNAPAVADRTVPAGPAISEFFSPADDLEGVWVRQIDSSTRWIHLACYGLSNEQIADALKRAAHRRVEVIILEDNRESSLRSDRYDSLADAGCRIVIKRSKTLLHDKFGVFDGTTAILGSYNLSEAAQAQDNSLTLFRNDPVDAGRIEGGWETMFRREVGRGYSPGITLPPVTPKGW